MTAIVSSSSSSSPFVPLDPLVSSENAGTAAAGADLLPAPAGGTAYEGGLAALFTLLSQQRSVGLSESQEGVAQNQAEQAKALADQLADIQREAANQSSSGNGFFGSIGKLVSDVVSDLAHGNLGDALTDAGNDASAAWNSPHFWSDLQSGLEAISVVGEAVSQVAQDIGGPAGTVVAVVALDVDQGAEIGADLAGAREESFAATAKGAEADALSSKNDITRSQTQVVAILEDAKSSDQALGQALDEIAGAIRTGGQTLVTSVTPRGAS